MCATERVCVCVHVCLRVERIPQLGRWGSAIMSQAGKEDREGEQKRKKEGGQKTELE